MPYFDIQLRNEETGNIHDTIDAYEMDCKDNYVFFKDSKSKVVAIIPLDVVLLIKKQEKKD